MDKRIPGTGFESDVSSFKNLPHPRFISYITTFSPSTYLPQENSSFFFVLFFAILILGTQDDPTDPLPPEDSRLTGTVNASYDKLGSEPFLALPEPKVPLPCFEPHEVSIVSFIQPPAFSLPPPFLYNHLVTMQSTNHFKFYFPC